MKPTVITKLISCVLLLVMLCGCVQIPFFGMAKMPEQTSMPEEELSQAVQKAEFSMLAAVFSDYKGITHVGDIDNDGDIEMVYGYNALAFDASDGKVLNLKYSQSGIDYQIGTDGYLYAIDSFGGCYEESEGIEQGYSSETYSKWDGKKWVASIEIESEKKTNIKNNKVLSEDYSALVDGDKLSRKDMEKLLEQLDLQDVDTYYADFTQSSYSSAYFEHFVSEFDKYLSSYSSYSGVNNADIDNDGLAEAVFVVPEIFSPWRSYAEGVEDNGYENGEYYETYTNNEANWNTYGTGILIADIIDGELVTNAFYTENSIYSIYDATYDGVFLNTDSENIFMPSDFETLNSLTDSQRNDVCAGVYQKLSNNGYYNICIQSADVIDDEGDELICTAQTDDERYFKVIKFVNGKPLFIYSTISDCAYYTIDYNNKPSVLSYSQSMQNQSKGVYYSYFYNIERFKSNGEADSLEHQSVSYYDTDSNTGASKFFDMFNNLLDDATVFHDPYSLTGSEYSSSGHYGYIENNLADSVETNLSGGYVTFKDENSWLNLRTGPGTNYDCVEYTDANGKKSIIKQAKGSPVTILETVETGDAENPTWYKIRITYQNEEFIGYSSANYIIVN